MLLILLSGLLGLVAASPLVTRSAPLPVIIWHGLGDRFDADGLADVATMIQEVHPSTYVRIINIGEDGAADQRASFFGNVTDQIDTVCAELTLDPELAAYNGRIDAMGFSQGGLFVRGLVQRCPGINVRNLITFGSPHNGIAELPACKAWDLVCKGAVSAFESNKWSDWVQGNLVPAQYFREIDSKTQLGSEDYLNYSSLLPDLNNEREVKNAEYKQRLSSLDNFALFLFSEDVTVVPKETSWFADVDLESGEITLLKDRLLYKEDWLGLKELDSKGKLTFRSVKGGHMRLTEKLLKKTFAEFFGPEKKSLASSLWSLLSSQDISLARGDW